MFPTKHIATAKNSLPEVLFRKGASKNLEKFTGKHLRWCKPATLLKRDCDTSALP